MNIAVRYYTRSGNTKKLADAIAEVTGVQAESVETPLSEKVDILFLGCSYYAFNLDEAVKRFAVENGKMTGKLVCFGTSAMMKSVLKPLKKATDGLDLPIDQREFHCRGEFKGVHKGRPNDDDLHRAAEFALDIIKTIEQ